MDAPRCAGASSAASSPPARASDVPRTARCAVWVGTSGLYAGRDVHPLRLAAILEAVQDHLTASGLKGLRDDPLAAPLGDDVATVRPKAHTDLESPAEQSVPDPAGPGPEQSVQAGPLGRLFLKISAKPIEILRAMDDLSERIGDRVLREIRAFRRESEAQHNVQDAKVGALQKLYDGLCRELDGVRKELDGIRKELDGIRKQIRLLVAMIALLLVFLGALVTVGLMNWFSLERASASPPSLEVQASTVEAQESSSAQDSPPPASATASADATRPGGDGSEESEPTIPPSP